jgi:hypothetical protein
VGKLNFVTKVKSELGLKGSHLAAMRRFNSSNVQKFKGSAERFEPEINGTYVLREETEAYGSNLTGKNEVLSSENTRFWNENSEVTAT